jgi:hypothetical protein
VQILCTPVLLFFHFRSREIARGGRRTAPMAVVTFSRGGNGEPKSDEFEKKKFGLSGIAVLEFLSEDRALVRAGYTFINVAFAHTAGRPIARGAVLIFHILTH